MFEYIYKKKQNKSVCANDFFGIRIQKKDGGAKKRMVNTKSIKRLKEEVKKTIF